MLFLETLCMTVVQLQVLQLLVLTVAEKRFLLTLGDLEYLLYHVSHVL